MIFERAYAKINLALEVFALKDGYHPVCNLMVPISVYDELFFQKSPTDEIDCPEIAQEDNLCWKAIRLFKEKYHIEEGVSLILKKNIPMQAGLAGGSSDAAATLRGLNRLFQVNAPLEELSDLAVQLGMDVPFFLHTKAALCSGRGEIVELLPFPVVSLPILLIKPPFGLSTKEIYQQYVYDGISKSRQIQALLQALPEGDVSSLEENTFNDLEKTALQNETLNEIFDRLKHLSYAPHLSGSGPTIFLLDATAMDFDIIQKEFPECQVIFCRTQ